jgi:hypothetical protein
MRMLLIAGVLAGLGPAAVRAEPVQLDENGLRAVAAGAETAAAPISLNVNVTNPVNVSNQVDVSNQVGTGVAVGVNAAVAAFSNNVAATGAVTSSIGLSAP